MAITTFGTAFGRSTSEVLLDEARKLPKRNSRKHTLLLLSCYIDPERIQNLLENLLGIVKLTNVHLSFNISEAFRIGPASVKSQMKTLGEWCKSKRVKLKWQALCAGTLVHSKGYSLYQTGKDANEVLAGFFLVGSPNLTKPGFFEARNIELGYISDNLDELVSFINTYDELAERFGKDIDDEVFKQNQALFRFSLLSEGIFLHKWDGSLSKLVGIRYQMTAEGRRNTQLAQEFVELGIEPGNSVTLQPIGLKYLPQKTISSGFVRKYTVDTLLGRWCPLDVWRTVAESIENKTNFLAQFRDATKPERMKEVLEKAQSIQTRLLERQLIKAVPSGFLESWTEKISELRDDSNSLSRLVTGYETHRMSYDIRSESEIKELFESLQWTIKYGKTKNFAKTRVLAAIKDKSLKPLRLSISQKRDLLADYGTLANDDEPNE